MKKILGILSIFSLLFLSHFIFVDYAEAGVITISPTAVRPSDYLSNRYFWYANPDEFFFDVYETGFEVFVPVNIPNAVLIKGFVAYLSDGTGRWESLSVYLERHNLKSGEVDIMASVGTGFTTVTRARLVARTIDNGKIINHTYSYHLRLVFNSADPSLKFHGAKIIY